MALATDDPARPLPDGDGGAPASARRAHRRHGERRLTPFERALRERIAAQGPISVEAYMHACNAYYYATRDPFGDSGDFTTAPEISQMFGELIGAALADCWKRAGAPSDAVYAELGPGRGTLAADALRVLRAVGFAGDVHLVETSPRLRAAQAECIPDAQWHDDLQGLPSRPTMLVANEFFDALPVRQFIGEDERRVTVAEGGLAFDRDGEIVEDSPARTDMARQIAGGIAKHGGVALIVDYGHPKSAPGDTFQAVRRHGFVPVLANPGDQDLTAHVDFEAFGRAAGAAGAKVAPLARQGEWLERLGIGARAKVLGEAHPDRAEEIEAARRRLCDPGQMGDLFKVMAIHGGGWAAPAGFAQ